MGGLALPVSSIVLPAPTTEPFYDSGESKEAFEHSRFPIDHVDRGKSAIDHFYAIAARLPPPPSLLGNGQGALDATNLGVYHNGAYKRDRAAGLVSLPPLNCCAGMCRCPGGMCGCGSECCGSCGNHSMSSGMGSEQQGRHNKANLKGWKSIRTPKATVGCCIRPLTTATGSLTSS